MVSRVISARPLDLTAPFEEGRIMLMFTTNENERRRGHSRIDSIFNAFGIFLATTLDTVCFNEAAIRKHTITVHCTHQLHRIQL